MYRIASTMLMLPPVALIILLLSSSPKLLADAAHAQSFCSNANAMYTRDDTYRSNLIDLANELIANATGNQKSHLATSTAGTGPGKVYGAAICRGDSTGKACADRLQKALDKATSNNSSIVTAASKNVTLFDDDYQAQLIFSDEDFISSFISNSPECTVRAYLNTPPNTVDPELFTKLVTELMEKLTDDAAAAERPGRYSTGQGWLDEKSQAVYGLAQCTEDMSPESCRSCLAGVTAEVKGMGESGLTGGAILGVRCSMWYQTDIKFFSADPMVSLHMPTPSKFWIWVTIGSFSLIASISWLLVHIWIKTERKREQARHKARLLSMAIQNVINLWRIEEGNSGFSLYDFTQIKEATQNFSAENKLGQGGFGPVYKGLLPGGLEVAVKRLAACSVQGLLEFKNEIQLIAKLQHKNLVRLLGCCIEGDQEKILVYEYLHNKSLDIFIFDCAKGAQLNWSKRQRIIDGIAQGILYLHNHSRLCVVHRDLKASNILLDSDMAPKISDFGMARIFCSNMTESNTTRIVGTHGYISPEYAFDGVCSIKSDVFSFGVLVVEIISGKRTTSFYPYDGKLYNLISYAWQLWRSGRWQELVCCSIGQNHQVIQRCIQVALLCVQERADDRPTIDQVLTMLNSEEMTLPKPNQPAYFFARSTASEVSSSDSSITITLAR